MLKFNIKSKYSYLVISIIFIAILDQVSKYAIFDMIMENEYIRITSFFNLVKVYNNGVSFGMFNSFEYSRYIFSIINIGLIGILLAWFHREKNFLVIMSIPLIISGAIGNLADRILIGAVMDFLDFHIFGYHWPAFNVADSVVFVGVGILLFTNFANNKNDKK